MCKNRSLYQAVIATDFFSVERYTFHTNEFRAGGALLRIYLDVVILLNFLVDYLLLLGTNRLAGYPVGAVRSAAAAALGGLYGGACLIPGFRFLGNMLWRLVSLGAMGVIAFGLNRSTLRRCVLFILLSMALGGIALGLGSNSFPALLGATGGVTGLCMVGFRGRADNKSYIPVELEHRGRQIRFMALYDTGNTLRDPMTGAPVLIAGQKIAAELADLTPAELGNPVMTMTKRPGLRLIPYRAVGKEHGMLLAMKVPRAKIDNREQGILIAFAPEGLGQAGEFEALIGGA